MKRYVKPTIECVIIRPEERLAAACDNPGYCKEPSPDFNGNDIPDYFTIS
jgi:hypothetical protein